MPQSAPSSQGVGDPFQHLVSEIREMIITYLDCYQEFDSLYLASPVMRKERRTSTLLLISESLEQIFGGTSHGALMEAHMYLLLTKNGLSGENFALWNKRKLPHPLFSSRQDIVFRMNALYCHLMDCFNLGPEIVPWFITKLPDSLFARRAAETFGGNGERFPTSLKDASDVKKGQVLSFLLAVKMAGNPYIYEHELPFGTAVSKIWE